MMNNSKFWGTIDDWLHHAKYLEVMGGESIHERVQTICRKINLRWYCKGCRNKF